MSRDADDIGSIGSQSGGGSSGGGVSVESSGTRSIPAPRWLGKRVGRFKLVALLGQGAMGRVFRAEDTLMGRHVALKVLPKSLRKGSVKLRPEVLINEARAAAAIEHPNAVQVYEVNQAGDVCYVAMELLEGGSLRDLVRAAGPMDLTRACILCAEAAEALAAAHAAGVIHRDVKPANLMLSRQGRCKVVDFGLARLESPSDWGAIAESVGTPQFIAPELLSGTPASAQSDIYSLAGTLWYLLTGSPPYQGKDAQELLRMHMESPVPDLRSARPEAPAALAEAIKTAMAKRPVDRFATMEQFARVLRVHAIPVPGAQEPLPQPPQHAVTPGNGRSRRPSTPIDPASKVAAQAVLEPGQSNGSRGIGWMVFAGAAILVVAVVAVICVILTHPGASASQSASQSTSPPAQPPVTNVPANNSLAVAPTAPNTVAAPAPTTPNPTTPPPTLSPAAQAAVHPAVLPPAVLQIGDFEQQMDIGNVGHHGYVDPDSTTPHRYRLTSSGKDIYGHADAFHFVWRKMDGDVTIKASISILGAKKDASQKGVLMVRQGLDAGAPFADAAMHADGTIALQFRRQADGPSDRRVATTTSSTVWLERNGNQFTMYVADTEGKPDPAASITLPMADPVYVGIGVSSHDVNKQVTAVFSDVALKQGTINSK